MDACIRRVAWCVFRFIVLKAIKLANLCSRERVKEMIREIAWENRTLLYLLVITPVAHLKSTSILLQTHTKHHLRHTNWLNIRLVVSTQENIILLCQHFMGHIHPLASVSQPHSAFQTCSDTHLPVTHHTALNQWNTVCLCYKCMGVLTYYDTYKTVLSHCFFPLIMSR